MKTIDHIALLVENLDESRKWYEDNLDAVCVYDDKFYKRMQVSNTTIALICKNRYDHNHVGILVNNKEDLPLEGKRIKHRDGTIGVYTFDNSGYCIEFIYYPNEVKKKMDP